MELVKQSGKVSLSGRSSLQAYLGELLAQAGIEVGGDRPWDMQVNSPDVAERIFTEGSLGLGESYMEGAWEVQALDEFIHRVLRAKLHREVRPTRVLLHYLKARLFNRQTVSRAKEVGKQHYDLGNDFYRAMLDPRMTYTCGYWRDATTLTQAQEAKLDLVCRKLQLEPGMRVLDIGCGWGSFMAYAAEHYGVECVGLTISREQADLARQMYPDLPLDFRLQDYRDVDETFDRLVSIGMFEHVGNKNYRTYMEVAHRSLKDGGLFLLHTIGKNERAPHSDPWMDKYIFPNGELPSIGQIGDAVDNLFVVEDLHNFGADYDRTLMAWYRNFEAAWPRFAGELGDRFFRMWRFYLLSCAGAFRARDLQVWQWVLSKGGHEGVYPRVT
ncbi:cyclopropane fatty acyl phospholipid synthase [Marinobacter bryozoorum]|uniref:cyclopropane fatty acyl phospholipid synthase n=1 Tax=Marinobacter bryozoorum TaxID=256324 RepID=UPI002004E533|nr:cyclopropane fatty acyl phospholipid synthase [Marinobacter bryozoorum]MCK7545773.1 cyclopropane fatty acyl phospholipid synthase [Marinobacter bryozoorum]